jgi:6-phospho-beta-glucosidase
MGYSFGKSPPGVKDNKKATQIAYQIVLLIAKSVKMYKEMGFKGLIGFAHPHSMAYTRSDSKEDLKALEYHNDILNG